MRNHHFMAATVLGLLVSGVCMADGNKRATAKADAWLGRDASELLLQLRVDGGRVQIREIEETGETSYTWSTWNPAYTSQVVTGVDRNVVGMNRRSPVFQDTVYTKDVYHPATHRCDITYYANSAGIISRWEYQGGACRRDIEKPDD